MSIYNDLVSEIVAHDEQIKINYDLLKIYEGQLLKYVEEHLKNELNPQAYQRAKKRISPINFLARIINKISGIYNISPYRYCQSPKQDELMKYYEEKLDVNSELSYFQRMLNLHKYSALELYLDNNELALRTIPADRFFIYSTDNVNPTNITHVIVFLGEYDVHSEKYDDQGNLIQNSTYTTQERLSKYRVYSNEEIVTFNSKGDILDRRENSLGFIPYIIGRQSKVDLIPTSNADNFQLSKIVPILLSDLNYSVQYLSHSIVYALDIDINNIEGNPDSVWSMKSDQQEGASPQIGTIDPSVNISEVLKLIYETAIMWFESYGIKTNASSGKANDASGVAKILDEASVIDINRSQINYFKSHIEPELWKKIGLFHNVINNGTLPGATKEFVPIVEFDDMKPKVNPSEQLDTELKKLEAGVTTREQVVKKLNPDLSDDEIQKLIKQIEGEKG